LYEWQLLAHFVSYVILSGSTSCACRQLLLMLLLLLEAWHLHARRLQKQHNHKFGIRCFSGFCATAVLGGQVLCS
jgi:hypothetical protein